MLCYALPSGISWISNPLPNIRLSKLPIAVNENMKKSDDNPPANTVMPLVSASGALKSWDAARTAIDKTADNTSDTLVSKAILKMQVISICILHSEEEYLNFFRPHDQSQSLHSYKIVAALYVLF